MIKSTTTHRDLPKKNPVVGVVGFAVIANSSSAHTYGDHLHFRFLCLSLRSWITQH